MLLKEKAICAHGDLYTCLFQASTLVIVCDSGCTSGQSTITVQAPSKQLRLSTTGDSMKLIQPTLEVPPVSI